jgi:Holliday junction resolvasome RuvABC endonuclease subunit
MNKPVTELVLAIDPANRTGFAHTDGLRNFVDITRFGDVHPGRRLLRFAEWLDETLANHKTELIAAEDSSFGSNNNNTAAMLNELRGVIHMVACEYDIPVKLFTPTTIKIHATGRRFASKQQMVRAAKSYFEIDIADDNIADAMWILDLGQRRDCWPEKKEKRPRPPKTRPPQKRFRFGR